MEIKAISQKIFKSSANQVEKSNQTNPFGVGFNGNLVSADVFCSSTKKAHLTDRISRKSKMLVSALVGSMNDVSQAISSRFNSVISFGKRIGEKATTAWKALHINNIKAHFENIQQKSKELMGLQKNPYSGKSVDELSRLFEEAIEERAVVA